MLTPLEAIDGAQNLDGGVPPTALEAAALLNALVYLRTGYACKIDVAHMLELEISFRNRGKKCFTGIAAELAERGADL